MRLTFDSDGWSDYVYWQTADRKILKKINSLVDDVMLDDPFEGIGKPEPLKHYLAGAWSRRIDQEHRLVYMIDGDDLIILQCRYHY